VGTNATEAAYRWSAGGMTFSAIPSVCLCGRLLVRRGRRRRDQRLEPPRAREALAPVREPHVLDAHFAARSRRMDELAVADVDADMRERAFQRVEEHQVPRPQLVAAHADQPRRAGLLVNPPRQHEPETGLHDVAREAAAVEAAF